MRTLESLKGEDGPDEGKVFNLVRGLQKETDDDPSAASSERAASTDERGDRKLPQRITAQLGARPHSSGITADSQTELEQPSASGPAGAVAELGPGAAPDDTSDDGAGSAESTRPRINLGLDGSVMRRAALDARDAAPPAPRRRRPVFSLSHWSQGVIRALAQKSAPWEGRALLTLEWDAQGQLLSVTSSAASSNSEDWQRLASGISAQLATRRNVGAPGKGFRAVYLIKSDLALPDKHSSLPTAKFASADQLRVDRLPPASAFNFGIKADGSAAATRVVSVELVRSDAL